MNVCTKWIFPWTFMEIKIEVDEWMARPMDGWKRPFLSPCPISLVKNFTGEDNCVTTHMALLQCKIFKITPFMRNMAVQLHIECLWRILAIHLSFWQVWVMPGKITLCPILPSFHTVHPIEYVQGLVCLYLLKSWSQISDRWHGITWTNAAQIIDICVPQCLQVFLLI